MVPESEHNEDVCKTSTCDNLTLRAPKLKAKGQLQVKSYAVTIKGVLCFHGNKYFLCTVHLLHMGAVSLCLQLENANQNKVHSVGAVAKLKQKPQRTAT